MLLVARRAVEVAKGNLVPPCIETLDYFFFAVSNMLSMDINMKI